MKKAQIKKSVSALAMAAVIAVSLFGYGCGAKSASTSLTQVCPVTSPPLPRLRRRRFRHPDPDRRRHHRLHRRGKDETPGIGTMALEQLPGAIAESGSIAVDGVATATITSDAIKELLLPLWSQPA